MTTDRLELVIADKTFSSWSLRPWILLRTAGIPFEERSIYLGRDDTRERIARVSPSGWIPVLMVGEQPIWDSLAICEYLAEAFPDRNMWPEDRMARALARAVTAEMHSGFRSFPTGLRMDVTVRHPRPVMEGKLGSDIARIQEIWRSMRLRFGGDGRFLFGDFGIADAFFAPVVTRFVTYDIPCDPIGRAYMDAVLALPAMQQWTREAVAEKAAQAGAQQG